LEHPGLQENACWAIRNAAYKNDRNRGIIGQKNGIELLLQVMETHIQSPLVEEHVFRALWNCVQNHPDNSKRMREHKGIHLLLKKS